MATIDFNNLNHLCKCLTDKNSTTTDDNKNRYVRLEWDNDVVDVPTKDTFLSKIDEKIKENNLVAGEGITIDNRVISTKLQYKDVPETELKETKKVQLYTEDYAIYPKTSVDNIEGYQVDDTLSDVSKNPVENKIITEALNTETVERVAADKALDNKIDSITAVQIRNKSIIECTEKEVQTVATQYIVDNYQRQPKNFDGLIITVTDKSNDKILYIYSEASNIWINSGINDVDLSDYYTKEQIDEKLTATGQSIQQEIVDRTNADIALGARIDNVSESLTNEIARAIAAENTNKAAIETEATNRENADKTLQDNIDAERDRASAAELENRNLINTEIIERKTAITNLNKQVMLFDIYSTETEFKTISVLVPKEG